MKNRAKTRAALDRARVRLQRSRVKITHCTYALGFPIPRSVFAEQYALVLPRRSRAAFWRRMQGAREAQLQIFKNAAT